MTEIYSKRSNNRRGVRPCTATWIRSARARRVRTARTWNIHSVPLTLTHSHTEQATPCTHPSVRCRRSACTSRRAARLVGRNALRESCVSSLTGLNSRLEPAVGAVPWPLLRVRPTERWTGVFYRPSPEKRSAFHTPHSPESENSGARRTDNWICWWGATCGGGRDCGYCCCVVRFNCCCSEEVIVGISLKVLLLYLTRKEQGISVLKCFIKLILAKCVAFIQLPDCYYQYVFRLFTLLTIIRRSELNIKNYSNHFLDS